MILVKTNKRRITMLAAAATLVASVVVTAAVEQSSASDTPPTLTASQITQATLSWSAEHGDADPTSIQHVQTTRQQAVQLSSSDIIKDDAPSFLIIARGNFTETNMPVPYGGQPPTGSVLSIVMDATSGQITDWGLTNDVPSLSALGQVATDR